MSTVSQPQAVPPPPPPPPPSPVRLRGRLDPGLSRWVWLVKWILAIPHWIVLAFLWVAFVVMTVVAFVAILVTGRYPRPVFDFTVGVLRWSWRVAFYTNAAFGTDRYPPFTLAPVADYPADLDVEYPERLSRGLVLVKWWLLVLPQYLVVGLLVGAPWWVWRDQDYGWSFGASGLIGLLALIGIIAHLATGSYPRSLFDVVMGMNRWVARVGAYAALMTDRYPPFRLDTGPDEGEPVSDPAGAPASAAGVGRAATPHPPARWGAGPVTAVVLGAVLCLGALPTIAGGITGLVADGSARDADGFLTSPPARLSGVGYAVRSPAMLLEPVGASAGTPVAAAGTVRVRVTPVDPTRPVFLGIAPRAQVDRYLTGVASGTVDTTQDGADRGAVIPVREQAGTAPALPPTAVDIWVAQAAGPGTQTVTWQPVPGDWTLVVATTSATPGVDVVVDGAAEVPWLGTLALWLLLGGVVLAVGGAAAIGGGVAAAPPPGPDGTPRPGRDQRLNPCGEGIGSASQGADPVKGRG